MRRFEEVNKEFRKTNGDIILPCRKTFGSAGYDFVTPVDILIKANSVSDLIFTDVKVKMLENEFLQLHVRSSLGIKKGISLVNTTGIIDSDYYSNPDNDGNIGFKLRNNTDSDVMIKAGERVMQGIFVEYKIADNCNAFDERNGGFGSTNE